MMGPYPGFPQRQSLLQMPICCHLMQGCQPGEQEGEEEKEEGQTRGGGPQDDEMLRPTGLSSQRSQEEPPVHTAPQQEEGEEAICQLLSPIDPRSSPHAELTALSRWLGDIFGVCGNRRWGSKAPHGAKWHGLISHEADGPVRKNRVHAE